jgi:hypothetical protein
MQTPINEKRDFHFLDNLARAGLGEGRIASATSRGAAMTMTNASPSVRGRRVKFTPQAIEKIKEFVAEGVSRDEIANRVGVTVGSLQVTCSRLGISLRRIILSNGSHHTADVSEFLLHAWSALRTCEIRRKYRSR